MNPDLRAIITSNEPPNDIQTGQIRLLLSSSESELAQLDTQIHRIESALRELKRRRVTKKLLVADLKRALSSGIRLVPTEILTEIFLVCRDEALERYNYSILDGSLAPLLLMRVSSHWRAVCLSTPRLWDHIHVRQLGGPQPTRLPPMSVQKQICRHLSQLPTSSRIPLDIQLENSLSRPSSFEPLFRIAMGAHDRVRRLTLNLDTFDDISELRTHPQDFPILACFELRVNAPGRPIGLSMLKTAPALRLFCLNTPSCSLDLEPAAVSWSQLTELTLNLQVDLGRARSILMECTGLEVCTIYTGDDWSEPPLQRLSSVTSLLHLTRFSILCCSDEDVEDFFDAFSFPSLTDLTVNATQLSELALPNLYSRSHFQLIKMDVDISEWVFTDELTTFLELTSSLEFLVLRVGGFQRTYMELFTYGGENPAPFALPKLRTLSIRMDHSMNTNPFKCRHDPSAAEMLESFERYPGKRNRAFPSLTRVFLTMIGDDFDRDIEKRLVNAGKRRIEGWYHRQRSADED